MLRIGTTYFETPGHDGFTLLLLSTHKSQTYSNFSCLVCTNDTTLIVSSIIFLSINSIEPAGKHNDDDNYSLLLRSGLINCAWSLLLLLFLLLLSFLSRRKQQ